MAARTLDVGELKQIKNNIIGNPSAKLQISTDVNLIRSLVESLHTAPNEIRIEAAHIISSLSYGSDQALDTLIHTDTPRVLLYTLSKFASSDPLALRSALVRAFRTLVVSIADIVGPDQWGLRPYTSHVRAQAKGTLDDIFHPSSLDIFLPLLVIPPSNASISSQIPVAITHLLANTVRTQEQRIMVSEWMPLAERVKVQGSKRGWEKTAMVGSAAPHRLGGWVVRHLARFLTGKDSKLHEAALWALAALAKDNPTVAIALAKSNDRETPPVINTILALSRSRSTDIKLAACLCATHVLRASAPNHPSVLGLPAIHNTGLGEDIIARTVINVVDRVIALPSTESTQTQIKACYILHYLVRDDQSLCQSAFNRGSVDKLVELTQHITRPELAALLWDEEDEPESVSMLREACLIALATLALTDNDVRRYISNTHPISSTSKVNPPTLPTGTAPLNMATTTSAASISTSVALSSPLPLMHILHISLSHPYTGVRYAATQCVRALTRAVAVLRTSILDCGIGMAIFGIVMGWNVKDIEWGSGLGPTLGNGSAGCGPTGTREGTRDKLVGGASASGNGSASGGAGEDMEMGDATSTSIASAPPPPPPPPPPSIVSREVKPNPYRSKVASTSTGVTVLGGSSARAEGTQGAALGSSMGSGTGKGKATDSTAGPEMATAASEGGELGKLAVGPPPGTRIPMFFDGFAQPGAYGDEEDRRVVHAALAGVCNMVNEFSPLRGTFLQQGLIPRLMMFLYGGEPTLRQNALWAIKNLLRKSSTDIKREVMDIIGWEYLEGLLNDPDNNVREQAFNTIRNLAENEQGVDLVFKEVGEERLLDDIADALSFEVLGGITTGETVAVGMGEGVGGTGDQAEGTGGTDVRLRHRPNEDVMLQAAYALANLSNGTEAHQYLILTHPRLLPAIRMCLAESPRPDIRRPAMSCVDALTRNIGVGYVTSGGSAFGGLGKRQLQQHKRGASVAAPAGGSSSIPTSISEAGITSASVTATTTTLSDRDRNHKPVTAGGSGRWEIVEAGFIPTLRHIAEYNIAGALGSGGAASGSGNGAAPGSSAGDHGYASGHHVGHTSYSGWYAHAPLGYTGPAGSYYGSHPGSGVASSWAAYMATPPVSTPTAHPHQMHSSLSYSNPLSVYAHGSHAHLPPSPSHMNPLPNPSADLARYAPATRFIPVPGYAGLASSPPAHAHPHTHSHSHPHAYGGSSSILGTSGPGTNPIPGGAGGYAAGVASAFHGPHSPTYPMVAGSTATTAPYPPMHPPTPPFGVGLPGSPLLGGVGVPSAGGGLSRTASSGGGATAAGISIGTTLATSGLFGISATSPLSPGSSATGAWGGGGIGGGGGGMGIFHVEEEVVEQARRVLDRLEHGGVYH